MRRGHAEITADKILDSRDLIARFDYLTNEREALADAAESEKDDAQGALAAWDADHAEELKALEDIIDEGTREFLHGETLIREDHFEDYARELAEDLGALKHCDHWPATCIDWEKAANELRWDYAEAEFLGHTYFFRA